MSRFKKKVLLNPCWTQRNKIIAGMLEADKSILDLGCGERDILKYYTPSEYYGVDKYSESADSNIDLNRECLVGKNCLVKKGWDYIICSGILEHIENIPLFLEDILNLGYLFILTWLPKSRYVKNEMRELISARYKIIKEVRWLKQIIFLARGDFNVS